LIDKIIIKEKNMSDINSVAIVGRVVEKPTVKYLASGSAVSDIRIANNSYQKGKDEKVNWLTVTVFGKQAENCEKYLDKGSQIIIDGRLDYQSWENKDGEKRSMVKIIANRVQFASGNKNNSSNDQPAEQSQPKPEPTLETTPAPAEQTNEQTDFNSKFDQPIDDTDDIPF
jgi:single-strand DNA-binding protein